MVACAVGWASSSGAAVAAFPGSNGKIAFMSSRSGNFDIYTMRGTTVIQLTTDPADDTRPSWSADGKRIVFVSTRTGSMGSVDLPDAVGVHGTGVTQVTTSSTNTDPDWSPDGQRITFVSFRTGNAEIFAMNADGAIRST
jgi:Tol biopolymer transport system component